MLNKLLAELKISILDHQESLILQLPFLQLQAIDERNALIGNLDSYGELDEALDIVRDLLSHDHVGKNDFTIEGFFFETLRDLEACIREIFCTIDLIDIVDGEILRCDNKILNYQEKLKQINHDFVDD